MLGTGIELLFLKKFFFLVYYTSRGRKTRQREREAFVGSKSLEWDGGMWNPHGMRGFKRLAESLIIIKIVGPLEGCLFTFFFFSPPRLFGSHAQDQIQMYIENDRYYFYHYDYYFNYVSITTIR